MFKKSFIALTAITFLVMSGCASYMAGSLKDTHYTENISFILTSKDKKKLVVISNNYHYVFDMPKTLPDLLNSTFRKKIEASFYNFRVDKTGRTTGKSTLILVTNDFLEKSEAVKFGMDEICCNPAGYVRNIYLTGQRFSSSGIENFSAKQKLNKTYNIDVAQEISDSEKHTTLLLSPLKIAADGIWMLSSGPLEMFLRIHFSENK